MVRGEIADTLFRLQSGTANLAKTQQDELLQSAIKLTKVYGGDLNENLQALVKNYQIVATRGGNVADVTGQLALVAERGNLKMADLAKQMPEVASKADAVGESFRTAAAAIEVATQRGGKTEKTFTATGNVFLRLAQAEQHGIKLTGTFTDKLRQLGELMPPSSGWICSAPRTSPSPTT